MDEETVECNDCGEDVEPDDPYYDYELCSECYHDRKVNDEPEFADWKM